MLANANTNEGEIVLDNCIGSGTTAVASLNTGRFFIGIEKELEYVEIAKRRVEQAQSQQSLLGGVIKIVKNLGEYLTPEQEEMAYLEMLELEAASWAKDYYLDYVEYVHRGQWKTARHLELICSELQKIIDEPDQSHRIMIFLPPRHGKTQVVTECFPSFFLGKFPNKRVMAVSYGDSLAQSFGKKNRQKINEFGTSMFGVSVSKQKSSMTNFDIEGYNGGMLSMGIGGSATGYGADLLVIDDVVKNKEEAQSQTYRDKIWGEWQNTFRTRLHPGASVILIMTRWHEDDLAGRLLNPEYGEVDDWTVIKLPAIAEENDLLGRQEGEALWPDHGFDNDWAVKTKNEVGTQTWNALYQQRPAPAEGAMIKREWFKFYEEVPTNFDLLLQSWDLSFKDSVGSDFVSGMVMGNVGANIYLLPDISYGRMDFPTTLDAIRKLTARNPKAHLKLIEDKANGPAVIAMLRKEIRGIIPITPKGSKVARVSAVSPLMEAGNVFLPSPKICSWVEDFIEECAAFPNGTHDDRVDSLSQGLQRFMYAREKKAKIKDRDEFLHRNTSNIDDVYRGGEPSDSYTRFGMK
jgi:predicted phage terminase large subunit-like protein